MFRCSGIATTVYIILFTAIGDLLIMLARINLCIQLNAVVTPLSRHCVHIEHGRYQPSFRGGVVGDE